MARYRLWRYAQSAKFAFGEGRLLLAHVGVRIPPGQRKEKRPPRWWSWNRGIHCVKIFARGSRERAPIPLLAKCEPRAFGAGIRILYSTAQKKKNRPQKMWSVFFGRGIGIRTPTYRVRVCCAAVTQFPYAFNGLYFSTHYSACQ